MPVLSTVIPRHGIGLALERYAQANTTMIIILTSCQPFPLNQSFRPPPPVSDALRTHIYFSYMADPEANSVRALAARHHLSIKRIDAILRLKGLEQSWKKVSSRTSSLS